MANNAFAINDWPIELLDIVLVDMFKSYYDEDEKIYELTRLSLQRKVVIPSEFINLPRMFERQKNIYKGVYNISVTCKALASAMKKSEMAWKYIFMTTIGATNWLHKAPYVFETKFNSSYRQMCRFLMTFGLKLRHAESENIDILKNKYVLKVSKHLIFFLLDGFVHRYNLRTKEWIKLASEIKIDLNVTPNWFFASHYFGRLNQDRKFEIYDLERDKLIQTYDTSYGYFPSCVKRVIDDKLVFLEQFDDFVCFGLNGEHSITTISDSYKTYYWDRPGSDLLVVENEGKKLPASVFRMGALKKRPSKITKIVYNRIIEGNMEKNPLTGAEISINEVANAFKVLGNYRFAREPPDSNMAPKFSVFPLSFKQDVKGVYIDGNPVTWKRYIWGTHLILWTVYPKSRTFVFDLA